MLDITGETHISRIDGVMRVYNGREPGSIIQYGNVLQHHELICKWSGNSISRLGDRTFSLSEGAILYLPKGRHTPYSVETLQKGEAIDILFQTDTPLAVEPTLLPAPHKSTIIDLFERCHETWRTGGKSKQLHCLSMLYELLAELCDETSRQYASPRAHAILEKAVCYLNDHCFEPNPDYAKLARLTGVSYSYLKKLFVAQYGIPPSRYIIQKRMEYAKTLLLTPELTVTDISKHLGYSSVYYFSRVFHEETGMTPSAYRREM